MLQLLADNTFLTLFIVIALGAGIGAIPIGGIRFGAAGTLFAGLLVGALIPDPTGDLAMLQSLGLGLFVYLVGLEAGETFFKELRSQLGVLLSAVAAIAVGAAVAIVGGMLLNVSREVTVGIFSGALTNTPSLALAQSQTGSDLPAVGYSLAYPTGVVVAILVVALFAGRTWKAPKDSVDPNEAVVEVVRVEVGQDMAVQDIVEAGGGRAHVATVQSAGRTTVVDPSLPVKRGDRLAIVAAKPVVDDVVAAVGRRVPRRWMLDRNIAVTTFTLSNRALVGRPLAEIPLFDKHRSTIVGIRRVDQKILPTPETYFEEGDILEVAHPVGAQDDVSTYLGDSKRNVSEFDLVTFATGLALGFAAALIVIPLPAGASFALGSAAGPLIVGLILGAMRNSPIGTTWKLPRTANFTLRQFGLMVFLAAVGIASGPAFAATALSMTGLISVGIGALVAAVTLVVFFVLMRLLGQSLPRAAGGASGIMSQPAVLGFASSRITDPRVMTGYSTVVTVAVIVKIVMVPLILMII